MSQPVKIENDAIRMEVWPQTGGKVSSVIDKADNFELLFSYPAELPTSSQYDVPYANTWYAGWDECFPAVHPSKYSGHPYDGIAVPDHGELWGLPTTAVPTKDGITTVWHGLRFGYRLTRKLYLDGPAVVSEYTLVNLAPFEFRFVWAMHALMSMTSPVEIDLARGPGALFRFSHDHNDKEIQQPFEWPVIAPNEDASRPTTLPKGRGWMLVAADPIESEMVIRYPSRNGRTVRIGYGSEDELPAYWSVWLNTGGWNGHRHFAIEPTSGRYAQIDRSIRDGSAGRIAPMGRRSWNVRWQLA
jgi:hypothetical protein